MRKLRWSGDCVMVMCLPGIEPVAPGDPCRARQSKPRERSHVDGLDGKIGDGFALLYVLQIECSQ